MSANVKAVADSPEVAADPPDCFINVRRGARNARVGASSIHARGLFAAKDLHAGEAVLAETPLVAQQDLRQRQQLLCCGDGLSFLDLGREDLDAVYDGEKSRQAAHDAVVDGRHGNVVACAGGCGELYASAARRDAHVARGHAALCVGKVPEDDAENDPRVAYRVLAAASNDILLLVADVAAAVLSGAADRGLFDAFVREPWDAVVRDAARLRGDCLDEADVLGQKLKALCAAAAPLLRDALALTYGADACAFVDADWLSRTVGTFEQNNVGVRVPHPFGDFPPLEGTALYAAICCANHSCEPTCDVIYDRGAFGDAPLAAVLVARRALAPGEELTIAYVEAAASKRRRRRALADYGFRCACARCAAGASDDDDDDDASDAEASSGDGASDAETASDDSASHDTASVDFPLYFWRDAGGALSDKLV